jgi:5-methylcytosine-specific restriction protein A
MSLGDLTVSAVESAISEFDRIGRDAFLAKYGFGPAQDFFIVQDGKSYDSKAIAGAAHGYLPGAEPLRADEFSGGEATVVRRLRLLGFRVPPKRSPPWVRDEVILACDLVAKNDWHYLTSEDPSVIELSGLLQQLPIHPPEVRSDTFRNPNGVARKTVDIATHHPDYPGLPTNGGAVDREVLEDFLRDPERMHAVAAEIRRLARDDQLSREVAIPVDEEDDGVREGRLLQRRHFVRERDRKLRQKKIADFLKTHPRVFCEICEFDFEETYGDRGKDFIEVHHKLPLHASGETKTRPKDLILVCSNCHRMIHRSVPWLQPEELAAALKSK